MAKSVASLGREFLGDRQTQRSALIHIWLWSWQPHHHATGCFKEYSRFQVGIYIGAGTSRACMLIDNKSISCWSRSRCTRLFLGIYTGQDNERQTSFLSLTFPRLKSLEWLPESEPNANRKRRICLKEITKHRSMPINLNKMGLSSTASSIIMRSSIQYDHMNDIFTTLTWI